MPAELGTFLPPVVGALGPSSGDGRVVRLLGDGELYEDAGGGWQRLRYDVARPQALSGAQQAQARSNIGAASATDLGDTSADPVAAYHAAKA